MNRLSWQQDPLIERIEHVIEGILPECLVVEGVHEKSGAATLRVTDKVNFWLATVVFNFSGLEVFIRETLADQGHLAGSYAFRTERVEEILPKLFKDIREAYIAFYGDTFDV